MKKIKKLYLFTILIGALVGVAYSGSIGITFNGSFLTPDRSEPVWGEWQTQDYNDPNEGEPAEVSSLSYIGIPDPNWNGLNPMTELTYRYYDDVNNQNEALTYYESDSGGYYTAYVYEDGPNSPTDTDNPYGTEAKPRRTIPTNVPWGSIIEVHGEYNAGGDPYPSSIMRIRQDYGTEEGPIFIRGVNVTIGDSLEVRFNGAWHIIEGFELNDAKFRQYLESTDGIAHHVMFRDLHIHSSDQTSGAMIQYGNGNDVIVYDCNIHNNGLIPYGSGSDVHGVLIGSGHERSWIIDCNIWENDGDSIQVNSASSDRSDYIYIAGNNMWGDRENAVDLKHCRHVIISHNNVSGYISDNRVFGSDPNERQVHGGTPTAFVTGNERGFGDTGAGTELTWVLFNNIYDNRMGVRADTDEFHSTTYMIGNVFFENDIGILTYKDANMYCASNIFYDCNVCFDSENNDNTYSNYSFFNNIFLKANGTSEYYESSGWIWNEDTDVLANTTVENNVFYDGSGFLWGASEYATVAAFISGTSTGTNCIEQDPLINDPNGYDFDLDGGSPALGVALADDINDFTGYFYTLYGIDINEPTKNLFTIGDINAPSL